MNEAPKPRKRRKRKAREVYNPITHDYTLVKPESRPKQGVNVRIRKKSFRNTKARAQGVMLLITDRQSKPRARAIREANERRTLEILAHEMRKIMRGTK